MKKSILFLAVLSFSTLTQAEPLGKNKIINLEESVIEYDHLQRSDGVKLKLVDVHADYSYKVGSDMVSMEKGIDTTDGVGATARLLVFSVKGKPRESKLDIEKGNDTFHLGTLLNVKDVEEAMYSGRPAIIWKLLLGQSPVENPKNSEIQTKVVIKFLADARREVLEDLLKKEDMVELRFMNRCKYNFTQGSATKPSVCHPAVADWFASEDEVYLKIGSGPEQHLSQYITDTFLRDLDQLGKP